MLLPPQFKDEALKALGPPIRKEEEKKPVEVEVRPGIYRVNGKLETRCDLPKCEHKNWGFSIDACMDCGVTGFQLAQRHPTVIEHVSEVDIPLPEFKPVWRNDCPPLRTNLLMRLLGRAAFTGCCISPSQWFYGMEWLDEGR